MRTPTRAGGRIARTLWQTVPTVLGIFVLNFVLVQFLPGDAADVMASESGQANAATMAQMRAQLGLDRSLPSQLAGYLGNLARFSLGVSPRLGRSVFDLIAERLPTTIFLMAGSLVTALILGVAAGTVMATHARRWPDRALSATILLFYSIPGFWFGLVSILLFSVTLGWLPSSGAYAIGKDLHGWHYAWDRISHLILPMATLATFFIAIFARVTRSAILQVSRQDFVRTAWAKGLRPRAVLLHHVLRNAFTPILTVAGLHLSTLLGGAVATEVVFGLPGLGRLAFESVLARDYPVLLGILLASSLLVIAVNTIVDLVQIRLDPRVEDA